MVQLRWIRDLVRARGRARHATPAPAGRATAALEAAAPPDDDVPPRGCGWFDSSHELRQGLRVDERTDAAALAQLSVGDWLRLELREWPGRALVP